MSYFINPVGEDRCVFLSYEGEMPAVERSTAHYEADAVLDQNRWHRLVVDVTQLLSVPTVPELFDFARGLSSNISRTRRVALVVRPEQEHHARLVQKVARRGRVFLTYFLDLDKAALWVKQSPNRQIMGRTGKEKPRSMNTHSVDMATFCANKLPMRLSANEHKIDAVAR